MKKLLASILAVVMIISVAACSVHPASSAAGNSVSSVPENTVTGDPSASDSIVVWGWNTDFDNLKAVLTQVCPDIAKRIVFVNAGGSDYYQGKIDEILKDKNNKLYPDIMLHA